MLRGKVLLFMVPLLLPIGQPPATSTSSADELAWEQPAGTPFNVPDAYVAFPARAAADAAEDFGQPVLP